MKLATILSMIAQERSRQEALLKAGRFKYTCASPGIKLVEKVAILGEEFGEVCAAVMQAANLCSDRSSSDLKKELIHVAAVAIAWLESMEGEG